ncbi:MAG: pyridoxamine 5'-phosphate oxidase family protein [Bacteroidota bacterium]
MAKFTEVLSQAHKSFIQKQKMFFTGTAALEADSRINISPKGLDTFAVLSEKEVAYLDLIGSGNETSAHTLQNARITLMFCSFDKVPNILRIYGKGKAILPETREWDTYAKHFIVPPNVRQIISVEIKSVQTSCGYGVPIYEFKGERDQFEKWTAKKGVEGLKAYIAEKNLQSIDGLETDWARKIQS